MESAARLDAELVSGARGGDVACLGAALERHRAAMFGVAMVILRDRARAEDAVQESFVVALRHLDSLRDSGALGPWLRTIVKNVCRMELRAHRDVPVPVPPDVTEFSVDEELDRLAVSDWVWTAMARLPENVRMTMMLRHFSRKASYAEIATVLGIPVGTVRSRLSQGRRYLTQALAATAAAAHYDQALLLSRRRREYEDALQLLNSEGRCAAYFANCAPDVLVATPAMGYETRGSGQEERNIETGYALGVRMRLIRIIASEGITIVEAEYDNPRNAPGHCPPWHTEIRVHPNGATTRLVLHFGPRT